MTEEEVNGNVERQGFAGSELAMMIKGFFRTVFASRIFISSVKTVAKVLAIAVTVIFFFSFFLYLVPLVQDYGSKHCRPGKDIANLSASSPEYRKIVNSLNNEVGRLSAKYNSLTPGQSYIVINTTENKFSLYRNRQLVREGFCSSGSYIRLVTPEGSREWIFRTPKGVFRIQQKVVKPMWIKPDWAFIEEGLPVPPPNHESRYERGVLGDYALSLGDGYLIHGTLYQRFIGLPVTHGCIRLGDEDLKEVFNTLNVGSKVFIF